MIGAYGETRESVTFILSGDWYENDEDFNTYRSNVYRNSPLFSKLENENYIMGLYTDELAYDKSLVERFDNVSELERGLPRIGEQQAVWLSLQVIGMVFLT